MGHIRQKSCPHQQFGSSSAFARKSTKKRTGPNQIFEEKSELLNPATPGNFVRTSDIFQDRSSEAGLGRVTMA